MRCLRFRWRVKQKQIANLSLFGLQIPVNQVRGSSLIRRDLDFCIFMSD